MSIVRTAYAFTPTSITGCALWLDGTDPAGNGVIPSAGTLSTWTDKSRSGNNAIAYTGATAPSYSPTTSNVTFGTNYYYIAGISSAPSAQTLFMVLRRTSTTWNTPYGTSIGGGATWYMDNTNPSFIAWNPFGQNNSSGANLLFYNNVTNVVCGTNSGGTNVMYLNGTGDTAGSTSFTSGGIMTIGTSSSGVNGSPTQNGFIGTISEVIFYNSVLGTTQRQQVEGYLAQKWGLTASLPLGHPGRTSRIYRSDYLVPNKVIPTPYYTQFSPRQIPGCSLWLDAADSSTITIQTGVSQWNDKSGQGRHVTQLTTSLQPVYSSVSNALVFNSNAWLGIPNALAAITPTYTIFVVDKRASASVHFFIGMHTNTGANVALVLGYNGTTTSHHTTAHITDCMVTIPAYAGTSEPRRLARYDYTGSLRDTYINGGQLSTIQSFSATLPTWNNANVGAGYYIAGTSGLDWWYVGNIHEIIFYNNVLTTEQSQQIESYLAQKWSLIPSLPGSHSHSTKQAGSVTTVALSKFKVTGLPRIVFTATGGTIVTSGFKYHVFTSSSNFVVSMDSKTVNYLVVGGGGGGGDRHGGGGGGGGVLSGTWTATVGTYTVTVGLGGLAGYYETNNSSPQGAGIKGGNSSLSGTGVSVTANGGGGGGTYDGNPTGTVGSGGGGGGNGFAGVAGTAGQGNAGGSGLQPGGGGGGGAGGNGTNANTGTGGIGTTSFSTHLLAVGYGTSFAVPTSPNVVISGGVAYIAAGGGGAASGGPGPGGSGGLGGGGRGDWNASFIQTGTANTGGGGGGSRSEDQSTSGRDGGSGLVLLWYTV